MIIGSVHIHVGRLLNVAESLDALRTSKKLGSRDITDLDSLTNMYCEQSLIIERQ